MKLCCLTLLQTNAVSWWCVTLHYLSKFCSLELIKRPVQFSHVFLCKFPCWRKIFYIPQKLLLRAVLSVVQRAIRSELWGAVRRCPGSPDVYTGILLMWSCCPWGPGGCLGTRLVPIYPTKGELPSWSLWLWPMEKDCMDAAPEQK